MPSSRIVDLVVGMAFVFGVTAALSSVVTELVARFVGLRAAFLLTGLRELLDGDAAPVARLDRASDSYSAFRVQVVAGSTTTAPTPPATEALLGSPILGSQGMTGTATDRHIAVSSTGGGGATITNGSALGRFAELRSLPSYLSPRAFATSVVDLVVPNSTGTTTMAAIRDSVAALPDSPFRSSVQALTKTAGDDVGVFRVSLERWYDDHMGRVSGWYKRRVARITLVVGALLVLLLNVNALTVARTLYTDGDVRSSMSAVAAQSTQCPAGGGQQACLEQLQARLSDAAGSGVPIGWGTVGACATPTAHCSWLQSRGLLDPSGSVPGSVWRLTLVVLGFIITITALVPGARFWFDLVGRLGSLRSTGPKPAPPPA